VANDIPDPNPSTLAPGEEWDATAGATKAAAAAGVDMAPIEGTGDGGTVTEADVAAHVAAQPVGSPSAPPEADPAAIEAAEQRVKEAQIAVDHAAAEKRLADSALQALVPHVPPPGVIAEDQKPPAGPGLRG
jgi:pyruvate/2-oxoglutarate dehydrogenase complex dihydrolipoamide acyltransferase (E2) component